MSLMSMYDQCDSFAPNYNSSVTYEAKLTIFMDFQDNMYT